MLFAGPEIRTGLLKGGGSAEVELVKGKTIKLSLDDAHCNSGDASMIYVDYKNLCKVVAVGNKVSAASMYLAIKSALAMKRCHSSWPANWDVLTTS